MGSIKIIYINVVIEPHISELILRTMQHKLEPNFLILIELKLELLQILLL